MPKASAIDKIIHPFNLNKPTTATIETVNGKRICVRTGKTARDKAAGHVAYKKNRRIWSESKGSSGQWVKV